MILGSILFAVVLNMKHLFMYMAPVYFIYLLKSYCFVSETVNTSGDRKITSDPLTTSVTNSVNFIAFVQ